MKRGRERSRQRAGVKVPGGGFSGRGRYRDTWGEVSKSQSAERGSSSSRYMSSRRPSR